MIQRRGSRPTGGVVFDGRRKQICCWCSFTDKSLMSSIQTLVHRYRTEPEKKENSSTSFHFTVSTKQTIDIIQRELVMASSFSSCCRLLLSALVGLNSLPSTFESIKNQFYWRNSIEKSVFSLLTSTRGFAAFAPAVCYFIRIYDMPSARYSRPTITVAVG